MRATTIVTKPIESCTVSLCSDLVTSAYSQSKKAFATPYNLLWFSFYFSEFHFRGRNVKGVASNVDVDIVATAVAMEGGGWTVQQRCLGAVTLDTFRPDDSAVSSIQKVSDTVDLYVVTGVKQM